MRIVHVSDCFAPRTGGIESQVGDLAARQVAQGHEVHVLTATLGEGGERAGVVDVERGVRVHRLGARLPFDLPVNPLTGPRLLSRALADIAPDAVHVHAGVVSPFAYDGVRLSARAGLPTAVTWHCMLDGVVAPLRLGARATRFPAARIALSAVSTAAAEHVRTAFGHRVAVVPNGIDVAAWAPRPSAVPATDGPVRLVSTMRLAPRKRAVPLVELVADAADRVGRDRVRLDVIGSGPASAAVEAAVRRRGLDGVVRLRGRLTREQVRDAYDDADVFLAPAELEAFGIAALEARTAGLVVLARTGTGIASFVQDGVDGRLVPSDAAMSDAVVALVEDPALLVRLREHNRRVPPPFDWSDVLAGAEQEYERARSLVRAA